MKKKGKRIKNKDEVADDWCFVCKEGGSLIICDYKNCLKSYHPECVGKDELFFETGTRWFCEWHTCFICRKISKFQCFCCPNSLCQRCITAAEFACIRRNKGFCNNCLKLALLGEENMDVDSDGEKVDFKDRETYEGLFKEYWDIIKEKEGLTLGDLHEADAQLKKGTKFKLGSFPKDSDKDDSEFKLGSCPKESDKDDPDPESEYEDEDDMEEAKPVQKSKRSDCLQLVTKREEKSTKTEFIGWGSKSLVSFLESIGRDTSKKLSQYDVASIINGYINENRLFVPEKKNKIVCDERLKSVLGRKKVNRNKIYDLLEPHFPENLDSSEEDDMGYSSEDKYENALVTRRKLRKLSEDKDGNAFVTSTKKWKLSSCRKSEENVMVFDAPQSCFASIVAENMKLVYLKRSLVQELLKQPETFEDKLIGSFVRVKSEPTNKKRNTHQLVQVTGIKKTSPGEGNMQILLQVSDMPGDICVNMLSDDNFSEEECEGLRQKVKAGLHKKLTIVEVEQKARSLHEDITKHWIARELALLQNLIDRANEKGWRRELFEYLERRQLLQTPSEQSRLIQKIPQVIADLEDVKPRSEDAIDGYDKGDESSPKSILMGGLENPGDSWGGSGISSEHSVTNRSYSSGITGFSSASDGNGNVQAKSGSDAGSKTQVVEEEHHGSRSIPEAKQAHASEKCSQDQPQPPEVLLPEMQVEEEEHHGIVSITVAKQTQTSETCIEDLFQPHVPVQVPEVQDNTFLQKYPCQTLPEERQGQTLTSESSIDDLPQQSHVCVAEVQGNVLLQRDCFQTLAEEGQKHSKASVVEGLLESSNASEVQSSVVVQSEPLKSSSPVAEQKQSRPQLSEQNLKQYQRRRRIVQRV